MVIAVQIKRRYISCWMLMVFLCSKSIKPMELSPFLRTAETSEIRKWNQGPLKKLCIEFTSCTFTFIQIKALYYFFCYKKTKKYVHFLWTVYSWLHAHILRFYYIFIGCSSLYKVRSTAPLKIPLFKY